MADRDPDEELRRRSASFTAVAVLVTCLVAAAVTIGLIAGFFWLIAEILRYGP